MKKHYKFILPFVLLLSIFWYYNQNEGIETSNKPISLTSENSETLKSKVKPKNSRQLFAQDRLLHEFNMQKNPLSGTIPMEEKQREFDNTLSIKQEGRSNRTTSSTYVSRGPSNLGGRTRAFAVDLTDATSNTLLSGGVSSGLFRSTNGGTSWTKVSANDEIHNVTALTQDPRAGFQNNWYYGTGEWTGNSASLGASYNGRGVWHSSDNGLTWAQLAVTSSVFESYDSDFDFINALEVNPVSGHLFIATVGSIYRYDGTNFTREQQSSGWTDVIIATTGRVYASLEGSGVWTSPTGNGSWTRIAQNGTPTAWASTGRIVLAEAPSNTNIIYALYENGNSNAIEADLWKYDLSTTTWTNYSAKLPDEPGNDSPGNDPFAIQGGYDLVVSVKPDNENFVVIGGTNVYKIENIVNDATFVRIGGYADNFGYALYSVGGVNHHSDIHALEFDPNNDDILYSGTDGGVHKTVDISAATIPWQSLNNGYVTYQYYHVALDPQSGSNIVIGGAQDNGTTRGGTDAGLADNTTMQSVFSGDGVAVAIGRLSTLTNYQLYVGAQQGIFYRDNNGYTDIAPANSNSQFVTYFYLDPDNNNNLYYAGNQTLYKTNSATTVTPTTWTNAGTLNTNENLRTFATTRGTYSAASSYMLIGGNNGSVFRFDDPANTASLSAAVNITPSTSSSGSIVSGLAIHPTNPDIVLAVYANYGINSIFLTTNATAASPTWTLVEKNLPAHSIRSAAITTVGTEIIYFVGTARGLYSNSDPVNNNWDLEGANTIGLAVVSSLAYRPSDKKLLIGTHGNGMFETTVEGSLSTKNFNKNTDLYSFPTPTLDVLNFRSSTIDFSKEIAYEIYSLTGKSVLKGTLNNKKIDVSRLNSGIHFVNLRAANTNHTLKFIKN